jgi:hypothetical protein
VGEGVLPVPTLGVGDVADFDSPISAVKGGKWVAEPAGLLDIDPVTGVAVARRAGHVRIKYSVGDKQVLSSDISISPLTSVTLGEGVTLTTGQGSVTVPVTLTSSVSTSGNIVTSLPDIARVRPSLAVVVTDERTAG